MIFLTSRSRLIAVLACLLCLSFFGVSLLNYYLTRESVRNEILRKDLPLTMDNIYSELTAAMTRPLLVSSSMAMDTFLRDWSSEGEVDQDRVIRYLNEIRNQYGFFTTFFVSAISNKYYRYNGLHKTVSPDDAHDVWFYRFINSGDEYDLDVDNDEGASNILTIFINYRVTDDNGRLLGVAGVGVRVAAMAELIVQFREKYHRSVFLTDLSGLVQLHSIPTMVERASLADLPGLAPLAQELLAVRDQQKTFSYESSEERYLMNVRYLESLKWLLYVEQNETEALAQARNNLIRSVVTGAIVSAVVIALACLVLNAYQKQLEALTIQDGLTGLANRRRLSMEFARVYQYWLRTGRQHWLLLLDLDGFKKVNDRLGHLEGDTLLKKVADAMSGTTRPTDLLARWGGDEFVILAEIDEEGARLMAWRLREAVRQACLQQGEAADEDPRSKVTVSCGLTMVVKGDTLDSALLRADLALYACKQAGGDGVEICPAEPAQGAGDLSMAQNLPS